MSASVVRPCLLTIRHFCLWFLLELPKLNLKQWITCSTIRYYQEFLWTLGNTCFLETIEGTVNWGSDNQGHWPFWTDNIITTFIVEENVMSIIYSHDFVAWNHFIVYVEQMKLLKYKKFQQREQCLFIKFKRVSYMNYMCILQTVTACVMLCRG